MLTNSHVPWDVEAWALLPSDLTRDTARGLPVDARTDIWAVGVVLYEMVAVRSLFAAASSSETLASILEWDPPQLARFEPLTPPEMQRIVSKALRKDREQRYQTSRDLVLDLQALRDEVRAKARPETVVTASAGSASATAVTPHPHVAHTPARRLAVLASAAVLLVALALGVWWWNSGPTPTSFAPATSAPVHAI